MTAPMNPESPRTDRPLFSADRPRWSLTGSGRRAACRVREGTCRNGLAKVLTGNRRDGEQVGWDQKQGMVDG